jgi:hypothetical protein
MAERIFSDTRMEFRKEGFHWRWMVFNMWDTLVDQGRAKLKSECITMARECRTLYRKRLSQK